MPDPTETSKKLHGEKEVPSFEIMTQTLDRKHLPSLKKGGAGESGVCYEAGASVEVAPGEALGSDGWGEKKKTPKAQHAGWCSATVFAAADVGRSA